MSKIADFIAMLRREGRSIRDENGNVIPGKVVPKPEPEPPTPPANKPKGGTMPQAHQHKVMNRHTPGE